MDPYAIIKQLRSQKIRVQKPLTLAEILHIESKYEIIFPPDLRELYMTGLPTGPEFVDWRKTF